MMHIKSRVSVFFCLLALFLLSANAQSATKIAVSGASVTAKSNDGNVPANTVDGSLSTRWSAYGDGQWILYDLGSTKTVSHVKIAWYRGNYRRSRFDIQTAPEGSTTFTTRFSGQSSGTTTALETYDFTDVNARYIRIVGHGNTENMWVSITETEIWGTSTTTIAPSPINGVNKPFPQSLTWTNAIKPNHVTQSAMNSAVASAYDYWKQKYLKPALTGGYYIQAGATGGTGEAKGQSEGHGWGMVITVLMAGHDPDAKQIYDGLYQFFSNHRSSINSELMGWYIDQQESGTGSYASATDGDLDIAYSLLLADKQWGSTGAINYRQEAVDMINKGIKQSLLKSTYRLSTGDWDADTHSSRSSDWMIDHLRAFKAATGDPVWDSAINEIYTMISEITASYSSSTGLMPDFVGGDPAQPNPNHATGETHAGDYFYNASRTPWRIAQDYVQFGDTRSKAASDRLIVWARSKVGSSFNFYNYFAGYKLSGQSLGYSYTDAAFIAPLVVASMTSPANQDFLNAGWNFIKGHRGSYFDDTINLQCLLLISGNWWAP